jgi:lipoprotein-releasing system permease protein
MGLSSNLQRPDLSSRIVAGGCIDFNCKQPEKAVLISEALARRLNLNVGAYFPIHVLVQRHIIDSVLGRGIQKQVPLTRKWKIKGVFKNEFSDLDRQLVYVDIRQLQQLLNCNAEACTAMEVQLVDNAKSAQCADQLNLQLPYTLLSRTVQERFSVLFAWFEKLHINAVIIFLLMLLVSLVNMSTALLIFILEHTRMVGQLLTLGYHKKGLQVLFLNIGMRFFLKGMLWGNLIALILGALQYFFHFIRLDETTYYVSYVVLEPSLWDVLWINAVFMSVGALTMVLPTLILSKLTPLKTLNFD